MPYSVVQAKERGPRQTVKSLRTGISRLTTREKKENEKGNEKQDRNKSVWRVEDKQLNQFRLIDNPISTSEGHRKGVCQSRRVTNLGVDRVA